MHPQVAPVSLPAIQAPVRHQLDQVLAEIRRIVVADFAPIAEVNQHLLHMRGKLFRPTLTLLAARCAGEAGSRQVTLAAVVELIHLATLVHDDSVDHSVLRRGQPTINALFSHQVAVIMGDYLYSRAIIELVELDDPEPLRVMARVTNDMTVGEMRQLAAHDVLDYTEEEYDRLIGSKTASLMSAACEIGGLQGSRRAREGLRRFGHYLGMAFQVTDDLLDYTESEAVTGKPTGLDLREHKITLPLIAALPRMTAEERRVAGDLMRDPEPSDDLIGAVIRLVEQRGGIETAQDRAAHLARRAEDELNGLPEGAARDALRDCVTYAIERRS
ncbi:MAG TPA: polyprenyl synthetase family protein [Gemmatimonadales bacterium]|nr:polyprenyl synthetase family protein [Gemmatimonadales bacterium]